MNAVIVDIRKKHAAALDESGRIVRIRNSNYEIGQKIELHELKPARAAKTLRRFGSGVAAAVLIAVLGTGTAYALPYGTVTLEGEAAVAYTINCFDYVLDVQAVNGEGEALLAEMDLHQLRHHRIGRAVSVTMEHFGRGGDPENAETPIGMFAETGNESHTERLRQELEPMLEGSGRPARQDEGMPEKLPTNSGDPDRPANPGDEAPQDETNTGSPQPKPPLAAAEQEAGDRRPGQEVPEPALSREGFSGDAPLDGRGLKPGIREQSPADSAPGEENPGSAS